MNKKNSLVVMLLIFAMSLIAACGTVEEGSGAETNSGNNSDDKKTLIMGTSADYPPFEYIDTSEGPEIIGFDVDLVNYITKELGYNLEIKDMAFDGLIGALQAERIDFAASTMSATAERAKSVDFSDIYFKSGEMIITRKNDGIESTDELAGKVIGVQLGSIQEDTAAELQETVENLELKKLNKAPELIQELKSNRIDGVVLDQTVAEGFLEQFDDLEGIVLESDSDGTAIAFPKDSALVEEFNGVIQEMKENGELDKLVDKWIAGEGN